MDESIKGVFEAIKIRLKQLKLMDGKSAPGQLYRTLLNYMEGLMMRHPQLKDEQRTEPKEILKRIEDIKENENLPYT